MDQPAAVVVVQAELAVVGDHRCQRYQGVDALARLVDRFYAKVRRDPECEICSKDPSEITDDELGVFPDYEAFCAAAG